MCYEVKKTGIENVINLLLTRKGECRYYNYSVQEAIK